MNVPAWVLALGSGLVAQACKALAYGLMQRRFKLVMLFQSEGLPSLPATVLSSLVTLMALRHGWGSPEAGFALVFAVIAVHDAVKLGRAARRQREVIFRLVDHAAPGGRLQQRAADFLDPRTHHPAHVVVGALLGGLFALAFAGAPG